MFSRREFYRFFFETIKKSGIALSNDIINKITSVGLKGQGYDNGANMAGKSQGVQALMNEFERYVPCAAHTLSLVGLHAAEVSPLIITYFCVVCLFI